MHNISAIYSPALVPKDTSTALNFDAVLTGFLLAYKHIHLYIYVYIQYICIIYLLYMYYMFTFVATLFMSKGDGPCQNVTIRHF